MSSRDNAMKLVFNVLSIQQNVDYLHGTPQSGLCFAGVLIRFRSSKFQALDMSYFSKGHAGFFREFKHDFVGERGRNSKF